MQHRPRKNGGYPVWKLEDNRRLPQPQGCPLSPLFYNVHQRPGRSEPRWAETGTYTGSADHPLVYKATNETQEAVKAMKKKMEKVSNLWRDTGFLVNPTGHTHSGALLTREQKTKQCQQSPSYSCSRASETTDIPRDPVRQNASQLTTHGSKGIEAKKRLLQC